MDDGVTDGATDTDQAIPLPEDCVQFAEEQILKFPVTIWGETSQEDTWLQNTCPYEVQVTWTTGFLSEDLVDGQVLTQEIPFSSDDEDYATAIAPGSSAHIRVTFAPPAGVTGTLEYVGKAKLIVEAYGMPAYTIMIGATGRAVMRKPPTPVIRAYASDGGEITSLDSDTCRPVGTHVKYDALGSYSAYSDGEILEYAWSLQGPNYDEGMGAHLYPNLAVQTVTFDRIGNYLATLFVRDAHGWSEKPASLLIHICGGL